MNAYQKSLIEEHSQLVVRINKLHNYVYNEEHNDDKIEFANKAIQLAAMRKYGECLVDRLENAGIIYDCGDYYEHVAAVKKVIPAPSTEGQPGSDYDVDNKTGDGE